MPTVRFYRRDVEVGKESRRQCDFCAAVLRAYETKDGRHWILLDRDGLASHVVTCGHYAWGLRTGLRLGVIRTDYVMPEDLAIAARATEPVGEIWPAMRTVLYAEHSVHAAQPRHARQAPRVQGPRWLKRPPAENNQIVQDWPPTYHTDVPLRILFGNERPGDRELLREIAP